MDKALTYKQVANLTGLEGLQRTRFLLYMTLRWNESEESKCYYGYAEEWAYRFKYGREFVFSDSEGRETLERVDLVLSTFGNKLMEDIDAYLSVG